MLLSRCLQTGVSSSSPLLRHSRRAAVNGESPRPTLPQSLSNCPVLTFPRRCGLVFKPPASSESLVRPRCHEPPRKISLPLLLLRDDAKQSPPSLPGQQRASTLRPGSPRPLAKLPRRRVEPPRPRRLALFPNCSADVYGYNQIYSAQKFFAGVFYCVTSNNLLSRHDARFRQQTRDSKTWVFKKRKGGVQHARATHLRISLRD